MLRLIIYFICLSIYKLHIPFILLNEEDPAHFFQSICQFILRFIKMKEKLKSPTIRMPKQCPLIKYIRKLIETTPN